MWRFAGRITRLVAAARDGHTSASLESDRNFDLIFEQFADGLFLTAGAKANEDAIGARLVSIDGTPAAEVRRRLSGFVPAENQYATVAYATYVRSAAALMAAGITHSLESAEFRLEKGGREFTLPATSRAAQERTPEWARGLPTLPLFRRRTDEFYWFEYLAEAKALYLQYNRCLEMRTLPFEKFAAQVLETAARESPEKLVIDLRLNGGGNSEVINPLLRAMAANRALRPRGGVYVLIGPGTFSSGMLAAVQLRDRFQAMLAGEPTGERPNGYGDIRYFRLPNSGVAIGYSTKRFAVAEGDPEALEPELRIPLAAADYFAGRDAVLDSVLRLPSSAEENFQGVIARDPRRASAYLALFKICQNQKHGADAEAVLRSGVAANPTAAELRMALADYYLERKKFSEARDVLARDAGSPGVLYELGKVNLAEGKLQEAADTYRKCYRMAPENLRGLRGVAEVYMKQHKRDEALRVLDEEAAKNPGDVDIPLLAAGVAADACKFDAEVAELQKAVGRLERRRADTFEIRLQLSEAYRRAGKAADAIRTFRAGCDAILSLVRTAGGNAAMLMGSLAGHYEELLKRQENDPVLMHELAAMLTIGGRDSDRALALARRSRELLPDIDEVGDGLGMIYISRKEWAPALELFRELARKTPGKASFHYHLAVALRGSGDREGAVPELREALRLGPAAEEKREIEALLAK